MKSLLILMFLLMLAIVALPIFFQNMKSLLILMFLLMLAIVALPIFADDLGNFGKIYKIHEESMLKTIKNRLTQMVSSGEWAEKNKQFQKQAKEHLKRPPGQILPRASEKYTHYFDPSVRIKNDIKDADGNILYRAGTVVNPLDYVNLTKPIILFDGDDTIQKKWVKAKIKNNSQYTLILTNGSLGDLIEAWKTRLYFDQHGKYVKKFNISSLPAYIYQEQKRLRIDEIFIEN